MFLRPYQQTAIDEILGALRLGKNPLLHLDTGAGKTVIFCEILKRLRAKGKHGVMVVRGRQLVAQASQRLHREGVPHGILMANHPGYRISEPIQIASVDTVISRGLKPKADLIVLDEAHLATSAGYKEFLSGYQCPVLSVTATPYNENGLGHIANEVVRPITFGELVERGFLVAPRYFAPSIPNLKGVKTQNGEYVQTDLAKKMDKGNLIGDLIHHYKTLASGRKAVCFAVTIAHSRHIADSFNSNGVPALHIDADSSLGERQEAVDKLKRGDISVLCNVGVLGLGVDIPFLDAAIMARPTKSLNLFIQQLGRCTRPYPGKKDFIVLDHAGNCLRHGFIEEEREAILTTSHSVKVSKSPTTCLQCFAVFYGSECPSCHNVNEKTFRKIEVREGDLVELTPRLVRKQIDQIRKQKGYKLGWRYFEAKRLYGEEEAERLFPKRVVPDWVRKKRASNAVSGS